MFRRNSANAEVTRDSADSVESASDGSELDAGHRPAGKGRPTPTRKEAEAAARARAKPARTRKEQNARARQQRQDRQLKVREAMRTGDDTHLPARDKGPVRRLVRDVVDSRFGFTELLMPLMVVSLILQYTGNPGLASTGVLIFMLMIVLVVLDIFWLRMRVRKQVRRRFPDESLKGLTFYAVTRSMQIKPLRLPKAQVKIGAALPEKY